jgi:hypothetical protein
MTNPTLIAITTSIALIEFRLSRMWTLAHEAHQAALRGEQNLALGTFAPIVQDIADAQALVNAVFVLHRLRPELTSKSKGGAL